MMNYIGIDPGKGGGLAILRDDDNPILCKLENPADVWESLAFGGWYLGPGSGHAMIEQISVHGKMPPGALVSIAKLMRHQGIMIGLVTALRISFELVGPAAWQRSIGCLTKGDKKISYRKAQELFPCVKVTHWNADALLIAEHCRRTCNQRNGVITGAPK